MRPRPVLSLALALAAVGLALGPPASADPTPTPAPEAPLRVVVTSLAPRAPQPHDAFEVRGYLTNLGGSTVRGVQVRLRLGPRITSRGDLHEADRDRPETSRVRDTSRPGASGTLAPGASTAFDIRTDVDTIGLGQIGVYPLDIEARGDVGNGLESLGLAPTWVPFFGDAHPKPTRVAVVWPLVDRPHQGTSPSPLLDDDLASSLSPHGRLGRLLTAARAAETPECDGAARRADGTVTPAATHCEAAPVTYAVDPDLLGAARLMTAPYKVRSDDRTASGTGTSAANTWLSSLKQALVGSPLLALPFADPDVTPLAATSGGQQDLARAQTLSDREVADTLGVAPVRSVAWPPAGPVSASASDALAQSGARGFVLDPSAFQPSDSEPYPTPSARTTLRTDSTGTPLAGLVADPYLSDLVTGSLASDIGSRLAEQRFLVETAMIAAEAPSIPRTLVIAPARRTDVDVYAAAGALRDLGRVPWLCPVSIASVADGIEHCAALPDEPAAVPTARGELRSDTTGMLSASYLAPLAVDRDRITQLTEAVLYAPADDNRLQAALADLKTRLRQGVARAESSAWRTDGTAARSASSQLGRDVQALAGRVTLRGGHALLTSSKGTLQVSIENALDLGIRVRVRFSSKTATLSAAETGLVEVDGKRAVSASVKAQAQRSGQFVVFAQVVDRNDQPFGPETEVVVRSTRYARLALAVTALGAGVLFVAAGIRIVRRALRKPDRDAPGTPA
jgi:hypothetical protein